MSATARRHELLRALGHVPLRLAGAVPPADAGDVAIDAPASLPPALVAAIARAGRIAPAEALRLLADAGIDPRDAAGKRALWPRLRAARERRG